MTFLVPPPPKLCAKCHHVAPGLFGPARCRLIGDSVDGRPARCAEARAHGAACGPDATYHHHYRQWPRPTAAAYALIHDMTSRTPASGAGTQPKVHAPVASGQLKAHEE